MGDSMAPALASGELFLMHEVSARTQLVAGDIVVLDHEGETLVKRVAAIAGEVLWGIDLNTPDGSPDMLLVADEADDAKQFLLRHPGIGVVIAVEVPRAHVFVVGDAPNSSWDSRQFGAVPVGEVKGRVILPRHAGRGSVPVLRFHSTVHGRGEP
jgi:signal peptidase I